MTINEMANKIAANKEARDYANKLMNEHTILSYDALIKLVYIVFFGEVK